MSTRNEIELWKKLEANENAFFNLHRSERVDWDEAVLLASPYPEVAIWNFAGAIQTTESEIEELIAKVEKFFAKQNMHSAFKINPLTQPESLQANLEERSYKLITEATTMLFGGSLRLFVISNKTQIERVNLDNIEAFTTTQLDGFGSGREWFAWFLETNTRNVDRNDHAFYLAKHENEPAGVLLTITTPEDVCGIYAVATLPKFRGKGIASALIGHVISDAERAGIEQITLSTATGGPAEGYFKKLGFASAYVSRFYQMSSR